MLVAASVFSEVVQLTSANFDSFIKEHPHTMVKFYATWCGHCKALAPKWEELSNGMTDIPVAEINCPDHQGVCGRYGVRGYPTIKMINQDFSAYDFEGEREAKAIAEWTLKIREPMFKPVQRSEIQSTEAHFIAFGPEDQMDDMEKRLASFKTKINVYYVVAEERKLVAVREGVEIETTDLKPGSLKHFVETNKVDFCPDIRKNYEYMVNKPGRQLVIFCISKDMNSDMLEELKELDKNSALGKPEAAFVNKFTLSMADAEEMGQFIEQFETPVGEAPFLVFYQGKNEKSRKYAKVILEEGESVVEQLKKAIDSWNAGTLKKAWIQDPNKKQKDEA